MGDKKFQGYSNVDIEDVEIFVDELSAQAVDVVDVSVNKFSSSAEVCAALDRIKMAVIQHLSELRSG